MAVKVELWGEWACFTRPEMKSERVSYDVITPSAARGILEAIYWHPGLAWIIDRIYLLSPIRFTSVRRNELKSKIPASALQAALNGSPAPLYISAKADINQRATLLLQDVHYVIEAHFELTKEATESDNAGKFQDIMRRRLEKGQCYHQPYFGCREFAAKFRPWQGGEIATAYPDSDLDFGYMLYDLDYSVPSHITPKFFRAEMKKGVLDLTHCEVIE